MQQPHGPSNEPGAEPTMSSIGTTPDVGQPRAAERHGLGAQVHDDAADDGVAFDGDGRRSVLG